MNFTLLIDYAHNAMALESLLTTLKEYDHGRLVCVFGCGGNRSRLRRYEMGEVSGRLADLTVITSDNRALKSPRLLLMISKQESVKRMGNISRFATGRKLSLTLLTTAGREISSCLPARGMRTIRKSKVSSILWTKGSLLQRS